MSGSSPVFTSQRAFKRELYGQVYPTKHLFASLWQNLKDFKIAELPLDDLSFSHREYDAFRTAVLSCHVSLEPLTRTSEIPRMEAALNLLLSQEQALSVDYRDLVTLFSIAKFSDVLLKKTPKKWYERRGPMLGPEALYHWKAHSKMPSFWATNSFRFYIETLPKALESIRAILYDPKRHDRSLSVVTTPGAALMSSVSPASVAPSETASPPPLASRRRLQRQSAETSAGSRPFETAATHSPRPRATFPAGLLTLLSTP